MDTLWASLNIVFSFMLSQERRKQMRNENLLTKLEYFSEECDDEREMEPRPARGWEQDRKKTQKRKDFRRKSRGIHASRSESSLASSSSPGEKGNLPPNENVYEDTISSARHQTKRKGSTRAFVTRYTDDTMYILGLHEEQCISKFIHGLKTRSLMEFLSTDLLTTYMDLMEKTYTWIEAKEVATNRAPNDHRKSFNRFMKVSTWDNNKGKKNIDKFSPYHESNHGLLSNLSKSPREILATKKDFQDSPDDEEDIRSSHEYQNDLEKEYQAITLLAKSNRFFKKGKAAEWPDIIPLTQITMWDQLVCLSEGDINNDPSLLRFYHNDDTSPWRNIKRKEKGEDGPEWIVRSKFEDELVNFMLKK
nr:hypothetical protein [Tanacetum cinerariifolium]